MKQKWSYKEITVHGSEDTRQNGCVLEHRYVAEKKIGRKLLPGEVVHHVDEDRTNNRPDNLMVFKTLADHTRFHHCGIAILLDDGSYESPKFAVRCEDGYYINRCLTCGKPCKREHCSNACAQFSNRVAERPDRSTLMSEIESMSFSAIGEKYGVSDNSIRKWAKQYGLPRTAEQKRIFFGW